MARRRGTKKARRASGRRSTGPVIRPERWFWIIVTFFVMVLAAFVIVGWLRALF